MNSPTATYDVVIAGAGPAGSSAAIHLANNGFKVLLVEQKKFPRAKLCGEFISPECLRHFDELGVAVDMFAAGPAELTTTVFYSNGGNRISVPSRWFGPGSAMGLSRASMDQNLLSKAKAIGVDVLEDATVNSIVVGEDAILGVKVKVESKEKEFRAAITIDATGRARALSRRLLRSNVGHLSKPRFVAFKAHLLNTKIESGVCEIYSYKSGYGGVSTIERGLSNICFIVDAALVKHCHSDPEVVLRNSVMTNVRAADTLQLAVIDTPWLSVALESFGRFKPSPATGLLAIGDSAAFIDPFTGSGMLMALESGDLVARVIVRHRDKLKEREGLKIVGADFLKAYNQTFDSRLRTSALLRHVAFRPRLAQATIALCSLSDSFRSWLARSTRAKKVREAAERCG